MSAPTSDYSLSVDIHPNAARFKEELKREIGDTDAVKVLVRANTAGFRRDLQTQADGMRPVKVRVEGDADDFRRKLQDRLSKLAAVKIGVTPDTAAFKQKLRDEFKAENLPNATVKVVADTASALASIAAVGDAIRSLPSTINLDVDTAAATASIAALRGSIATIAGTAVPIDVDTAAATGSIASLQGAISGLTGAAVNLDVDNTAALASVAAVSAAIRAMPTTVNLDVDTAAAAASIGTLRAALTGLGNVAVDITATVTGLREVRAMATAVTRLRAAAADVDININATVTGSARDISRLARAVRDLRAVATGPIDVDVNVNTTGPLAEITTLNRAIRSLSRLSFIAISIHIVINPPGIMAQLVALHGILSRLRGFNARATVGINTGNARSAIQLLIAAAISIAPAIIPVAAAATAAIGAIGPAAFAAAAGIGVMALAFSGVFDAVKALGDAQSKAGKSAADTANRARQIASAQDQVRDAYRGAQEAERNLANAQRDALRAQRDITRAREEAKEALEDLDSAVKNNALSIRQAKLDLADAEKNLAAVQNLPVDDRRRVEAQLQYDQAAQALDDLTTRQGRLATEQKKAAKAGVEGSEQVQAAQEKAADAQERVRDAAVALTRAQEQVVASQRDLRATIASTSATGGAAVDTLAQKMAALSPAGQAFARFLHNVKDEFKQVKAAAEAGLFPGLQRGIEAMLPVLPQIALFVGRVATAMGNLFEAAGKALASPFWVNFFDYMGKTAGPLLQALGGIIGGLARGFASLLVAFTPFSTQFMRGLAGITQAFADWAAGLAGSNGFNRFIEYVKAEGPKVLKLFGDLVIAVVKLGIAFAPLGTLILTGLTRLFDYLARQSPGHLAAIAGALGAIALAIFAVTGGPITAVVAALVAVAGAVVYAYTKFEGFRRVVDTVFGAAKLAVTTFIDAFRRGGDDVQNSGFLGAIERVGQQARRIFDGIREGVSAFVEGFKRGGTEIQQGGFIAYMQNLGMVARTVFEWLRDKGIPAVAAFLDWIGPKAVAYVKGTWQVFEFLFTVLNRVFQGITIAFGVAWTVWKAIFTAVVWYVENYMAPIFMWFWRNIIEPVWTGIKFMISLAWASIQVTFGLIQIGIKFLATYWVWLYEKVVKPVWDAISTAISWVWNNGIRPVLELFGSFIRDHVAPRFAAAVDGLKNIWGGLAEAAKIPIRFIVDTVLNDGLLAAYNWLADKFNVNPKNVRINVPGLTKAAPTVGGGGGAPKFYATGGYVTGPGGPTSDSILARLSAGEYVIPARIVSKIGVGYFDSLIGKKKRRRDTAGEFKFADGGIVEWAKSAWDTITDPIGALKDKALGLLGKIPGASEMVQVVSGVGRHIIGGVVDWARDKFVPQFGSGDPGDVGPGPGFPPWGQTPKNGGGYYDSGVWKSILNLVRQAGIPYNFGNSYRPGDPLWHGCVPMDTRIFTRRGWISRDEIHIGEDETIGYNPATGKNEWTLIVDVVEYEDAELWTLKNSWVELEVTPGHKWLVDQQVSVQTETVCTECGREFATGRGMTTHRGHAHKVYTPPVVRYEEQLVETRQFKQNTRVHLSKPADLGGQLQITDDEAELIGWIFADGYMEPYGPTIVQSKPDEVDYLKAFMAKFPHSVYLRKPEDRQNFEIYRFALTWDYWQDLSARSKASKAEAMEFVLSLSPSQRAAFLRGFLSGDGSRDLRTQDERLGYMAFQVSGPVAEAVKIAAYLEGYRPDTKVTTEFDADRFGTKPMEHIGFRTPIVKGRNLPVVSKRTAKVWCPTTTLGTWTARQGEEIFLTGNSGRAIDFMGYDQDRLAQFFMNMQGRVLELIHWSTKTGRKYGITRGRISNFPTQFPLHKNHVHIAMAKGGLVGDPGYVRVPHLLRDSGGYIPPGLSLVENRTGKDEWMFTDAQMQALTGRGESSGGDRPLVNVEQMYVTDTGPDDIAESLFWKLKTR